MRSLFSGLQQRASSHQRLRRYPGDLIAALVLAFLAGVASLSAHAQGSPTPTPLPVRQRPEPRVLLGGWYPWDPYQYRQNVHGVDVLTGFDVEIERAVARVMGVDLLLPETAWDIHLAGLANGTRDIAAGATYRPESEPYAYFSQPSPRAPRGLIFLQLTNS